MARCAFVKPVGVLCGAAALPGKKHCVFHDPASRAKTAAGRRKGGLNRKEPAATLPPDAPPLQLGTMSEVTAALGEAYNLVRTGRLAVNVGNCLAVLEAAAGSTRARRWA